MPPIFHQVAVGRGSSLNKAANCIYLKAFSFFPLLLMPPFNSFASYPLFVSPPTMPVLFAFVIHHHAYTHFSIQPYSICSYRDPDQSALMSPETFSLFKNEQWSTFQAIYDIFKKLCRVIFQTIFLQLFILRSCVAGVDAKTFVSH